MSITFAAGQEVTADDLNALVPKYVRQASDQTLNTTAMTNHNSWAAIAIGAGETWEMCVNGIIGDSTTASDIKTDFDVTGTVTTDRRHIVSMGVTATVSNDTSNINVQARATASDVSHGVTNSADTWGTIQEKLVVVGGASGGTITYRWSCVAASGNVTMKAGGHMIAHRVS